MFGVSQRYALTRYTSAVQSRRLAGFTLPIKFNGMAFTMQRPWSERTHGVNESRCHAHALGCVEYRQWGPYSYWQNNRLSYWPMIIAGDFDTLRPVFEFFLQMLPFAEARTRSYFQHAGVFFSETKTIFGSFGMDDYGCDHAGVPRQLLQNTYMRYDYGGNGGGTEVSLMILDAFLWSQNATDLQRYWPVVTQSLTFFMAHYPPRQGKVHIFPSQALETFQCPLEAGMNESWRNGAWAGGLNASNCVLNDAPTVAALHSLLEKVPTVLWPIFAVSLSLCLSLLHIFGGAGARTATGVWFAAGACELEALPERSPPTATGKWGASTLCQHCDLSVEGVEL